MRVLLFGGTSEGRALAQWLLAEDIPLTVCVATAYGAALLPPGLDVRTGRLDRAEMAALLADYTVAVDATHPYAAEATANIRAAAESAGVPVLRLLRSSEQGKNGLHAGDMAEAARMLETMPGNILLTTGSKELHHFTALAERCYPRVLPMMDSLRRCLDLGFPPAHILCMQGPFTKALNQALLEQYAIKTLVTKDTGEGGGFREKAEAAKEAGCALLVVERPTREAGLTLEEIKERLKS